MTSETTTADQTTLLCDATPDQMARFEAAARAAGHASGNSAANDWNLWGATVAGAIEAVNGGDTDAEREYRIAFARNDGSWDVVETFSAVDDDAANAYAEEHHADQDWYVLDACGRNINGGRDQ